MSSAGRCIARNTSSGTLVGPGIARNSRPARTTMLFIPCLSSQRLLRGRRSGGKRLSPGLAAAGGFGVIDRAEPARALGDVHLDLRVPAAGRLVIDAFAGAIDVALDGAVGRGRDRSGGRGQQNGVGMGRRFDGAENGGLLVADAPIPWRDERALPHARLGLARGLFVGVVIMRETDKGQRPTVP